MPLRTWSKDPREAWAADSLRGRFARGAIWSLVSALASQGGTLLTAIAVARILGREQFGEYAMIQSTIATLGVFSSFGLATTSTKYVAELRARDKVRAGRVIALGSLLASMFGGLLAVALYVLAPALAAHSLKVPSLALELRIGCLLLLFTAYNGFQLGTLSGFEAFRAVARINAIRGLVTLCGSITLGAFWKLPGTIWALVLAAFATCLSSHFQVRSYCSANCIRHRYSTAYRELNILWRFSTPAFLSGAMIGPVTWLAQSMLVSEPHGYKEMGVFSAGNQWRTAVVFLPMLLSQPLLSMLSNVGVDNQRSFSKLLRANVLFAFGLSSCAAAVIVACAPWIMRAYGPGFDEGATVMVLLVIAGVFNVASVVIGQANASVGRMWHTFTLNLLWAGLMLGTAAYLVPHYRGAGLATSFLVAYSIQAASYLWVMKSLAQFGINAPSGRSRCDAVVSHLTLSDHIPSASKTHHEL